jgi:hypothetical protein
VWNDILLWWSAILLRFALPLLLLLRNKPVGVIGGGDAAMEEASFLSRYASKVYIIHRFDYLEASKVMQRRVLNNPKIEVRQSSRPGCSRMFARGAVLRQAGDTAVSGWWGPDHAACLLTVNNKQRVRVDQTQAVDQRQLLMVVSAVPQIVWHSEALEAYGNEEDCLGG